MSNNSNNLNNSSVQTQNNSITNNKLKAIWAKRGIKILSSFVALSACVGVGVTLSNCTGCVGSNESSNYSDDDVNSDNKDNNVSGSNPNNENGANNETNNSAQSIETSESIEIPETFETNDYIETDIGATTEADNFEADFTNNQGLTADGVAMMSREYSEYVNKIAVLSHKNYKHDEFTEEDLYKTVYLFNADYVNAEEKAKLIEDENITDNIQTNVIKQRDFWNFYCNDTINKWQDGRTDFMDLTLILLDEKAIEVANTMNQILIGFVNDNESYDVNYKNYMDTVHFYAKGVTLYNNQYDYSKSIYTVNMSQLSAGGYYALSAMANCIEVIAQLKGYSNVDSSEMLLNSANDFSNLAGVFNGCNVYNEVEISEDKGDKQLTK